MIELGLVVSEVMYRLSFSLYIKILMMVWRVCIRLSSFDAARPRLMYNRHCRRTLLISFMIGGEDTLFIVFVLLR